MWNSNVDSATATVTVLDTINPQISGCPSDISVNVDAGNCSAVVTWTAPTSADNCNVDSIISNFVPGSAFPVGTTVVRYIAYDPSMNTDTCSFSITVTDNEDPVIANIPADIMVNNDAGNCSAVVNWAALTASDNCTVDSLVSNFTSGTAFPIGMTTVEYIAYDPSMNTDTISFTITVTDNELPTISCPSDTTICDGIFTFTVPTGNDNCGVFECGADRGATIWKLLSIGNNNQ